MKSVWKHGAIAFARRHSARGFIGGLSALDPIRHASFSLTIPWSWIRTPRTCGRVSLQIGEILR